MDPMSRVLFVIFCLCGFLQASAQQKEKPFDSLVNKLEINSGYRFYYDRKQTSDLQIPTLPANAELAIILEVVLKGTGLDYSIDSKKRVFISLAPIYTGVAKGF